MRISPMTTTCPTPPRTSSDLLRPGFPDSMHMKPALRMILQEWTIPLPIIIQQIPEFFTPRKQFFKIFFPKIYAAPVRNGCELLHGGFQIWRALPEHKQADVHHGGKEAVRPPP